MSASMHILFLICVAVATVAQCLTGFAFGLILLGLVAMFHIAPLPEVSIAVSILTCCNAVIALKGKRPMLEKPLLRPLLIASLLGVGVGLVILTALSNALIVWLKLLLGVLIVSCSFMLISSQLQRQAYSAPASFWVFGGLTGVLSGLFSSGGPPVVYHLYRQPLSFERARNTLVTIFAVNAGFRIFLVCVTGQLTLQPLYLSLEALPVVFTLTVLLKRHPPPLSPHAIKRLAFVLLLIAGATLIAQSYVSIATSHALASLNHQEIER